MHETSTAVFIPRPLENIDDRASREMVVVMDVAQVLPKHFILSTAVLLGLALLYRTYLGYKRRNDTPLSPYEDIHPLSDFDWATEDPIRLRPFKPKYFLTMAIENTSFEELICIDKTYLERLEMRRQIMADDPSETLACLPGAEPMVFELYDWLFSVLLPRRFPTMYTMQVSQAKKASGTVRHLRNLVTGEDIPLTPPSDPLEALKLISAHIDTDFLLLAPRPVPVGDDKHEDKYHLLGFATCFPSGFSSLSKLGLPLNAIHEPVPGYAVKLDRSMDRFFAAIPAGKIVKRANWSVSEQESLFVLKGIHLDVSGGADSASPADLEAEIQRQRDELDVSKCRLRCERQTLHRLPKTGGLVFAFKTYTYGLDEVKSEGPDMAEAMAVAIEGMDASVPQMATYKRVVVWGDKVIAYLRSQVRSPA